MRKYEPFSLDEKRIILILFIKNEHMAYLLLKHVIAAE